MIVSSSSFIATSLVLSHNAIKSAIFRAAEILMGLFIFKLFSLIAARSKTFTAYIMFAEDYIQRWLFVSSRGLTRASLIVLLFTILNLLASLYGTLLWALDSPGYVFRRSNHTVAEYGSLRNNGSSYIVQLQLEPDNLQRAEDTLAQAIGADLFKPGLNYSLTGEVRRGSREITKPTRRVGVSARIWLDDEGFSVSPDALVWLPTNALDGPDTFPLDCLSQGGGTATWSCTFNNSFSSPLAQTVVGKPDIYWDDESTDQLDYRSIIPNRVNNVWTSFGSGGGSAVMKQVFTVTKGRRRHTFVESVLRVTMWKNPKEDFQAQDVGDFVQRTWTTNGKGTDGFLPEQITKEMLKAQDNGVSYHAGINMPNNGGLSVLQSSWGYFNVLSPFSGSDLYTLIILTSTNITLIRSETLDEAPKPFGDCPLASYQNEAFGGTVTRTDCTGLGATNSVPNRFFGQVDTSAVLIIYGLGNGRSKSSAESLNDAALKWTERMSTRIDDLLIARAFISSVDPALVTITVEKLIVGMSGLQLFLSLLTILLAGASWGWLAFSTDWPWSNTFFANLIHTTSGNQTKQGYMSNPPHVEVSSHETGNYIAVHGRPVVLQDGSMVPMNVLNQQPTVGVMQVPGYQVVPQQGSYPHEQLERDTLMTSFSGKY